MNTDAYSLSDSYVTVGAGPMEMIDGFAQKWVGQHYMIAFALIIVLVLIVVYLVFKKKESFMPTSTMRMQQREALDTGADRSQSVFAQTTQADNALQIPSFSPDAHAAPGAPGSLGYLVLNSPDMACNTRTPVGDDAWSWMATNMSGASEGFTSDAKLSKIMAGQ